MEIEIATEMKMDRRKKQCRRRATRADAEGEAVRYLPHPDPLAVKHRRIAPSRPADGTDLKMDQKRKMSERSEFFRFPFFSL